MFAQSILAIAAATLKLPGVLPSQLMTAGVTGANVSGLTSNAKVRMVAPVHRDIHAVQADAVDCRIAQWHEL